MDFTKLARVEHKDQLILTTEQLAEFYECKIQQIKQNFNNNKEHFIEDKHYFKLEGETLKEFKSLVENFDLPINKFAPSLCLWTKRGAARHAKMLSTDRAWEVFEMLEDKYFDAKEKIETLPRVEKAVTVQNQPPVFHKLLDDINKSSKLMEEIFKVKNGIALAKSISVVEKFNCVDLSEIKELLPPAEHKIGYLTPTQLAKKLGLKSAQAVNKKLLELGLQEKDGNGGYILTDKGAEYGEAIPYEKNGHNGYQIKWCETVSEFF